MPRGLSPESKRWWWRLIRTIDKSMLLPGDRVALMLVADALAGYERAKKDISERGEFPAFVEMLTMYSEQLEIWLKEFFLTPASSWRNVELSPRPGMR